MTSRFCGIAFADKIITEDNGKSHHRHLYPFFRPQFSGLLPALGHLRRGHQRGREHTFAINLVEDETQQIILPLTGKFRSQAKKRHRGVTPTLWAPFFPDRANTPSFFSSAASKSARARW